MIFCFCVKSVRAAPILLSSGHTVMRALSSRSNTGGMKRDHIAETNGENEAPGKNPEVLQALMRKKHHLSKVRDEVFKKHIVVEIPESDIIETFVRGSGPG